MNLNLHILLKIYFDIVVWCNSKILNALLYSLFVTQARKDWSG